MFALTARYVFPVDAPPLPGGVITIDGQRIAAVGENISGHRPIDLGNMAILPGLVNAHTHLEFSDLGAPLGEPGMSFAQWIRRVVDHRRSRLASAAGRMDRLEELSNVVRSGVAEGLASGVTTVADIAAVAWPPEQTPNELDGCTLFWEQIGLSSSSVRPAAAKAKRWVESILRHAPNLRPGISPHAPYSVRLELLAALADLSAAGRFPLAMHVAESREEMELLQTGGGPLYELLTDLGAWDGSAIPGGARPMDYLKRLAEAHRALVIHGNYLSAEEAAFLGARADRMSVVFCPRTHAYFGCERYPLAAMLSAGVNVALGTDSRASNPDLNLLEELRFVAAHFPEVASPAVLSMGTSAGARALGLADELGGLAVGKLANLAVAGLPDREEQDPFALLLDSVEPIHMTYRRGQLIRAGDDVPIHP